VNGIDVSASSFIVDSGAGHFDVPNSLNTQAFLDSIKVGACTVTATLTITCTCTALTDLSPVTVVINGNNFVLQPSHYATFKKGVCTPFFQFTATVIIGNPFIKWFYSVFDYTGNRVGFAPTTGGPTIN